MHVQTSSGLPECSGERAQHGRSISEDFEHFDDDCEGVFDEVIEGKCLDMDWCKENIHAVLSRSFGSM